MSFWSEIEKLKEKYNILHWAVMTFVFLGGLFLNATYQFVDWIAVPFDNKKDITILLERSEEIGKLFEDQKTFQKEYLDNEENQNEQIKNLQEQLKNNDIEFKATIRRLEDGQLQLFLKTERLDERTTKRK